MNRLVATSLSHLRSDFLPKLLSCLTGVGVCLFSSAFATGGNSVSLAWDPNPEENISHYELRFGTETGIYTQTVDSGINTSATAEGLFQGTTYYFTVVAFNLFGQASAPSEEAVYTVPGELNTGPTSESFSVALDEDSSTSVQLLATDVEGDSLEYSILSEPSKGSLSGVAPHLTYVPDANVTGTDSFTFRATDGQFDSEIATVTLNIAPINDLPVADNKSVTTSEEVNVAVTLSGSDVDGDSLDYSIISPPSKGTLTGNAPNLTYRPAVGMIGADSFTYRVHDGTGFSSAATVSLIINEINDVPIANSRSATTSEDTGVGILVSGSDPDGSSITYILVSGPSSGVLSGSLPNVVYTPGANYHGADSFRFRVNDGQLDSGIATVSITVTPVNDQPVASSLSVSTSENTNVSIHLQGTDVDGDALTYSILSQPSKGTLSGAAPNLIYTPDEDSTGGDSFTYRVNDGVSDSAIATVSISISEVNDPPVAFARNVTTQEDTNLPITLTGSDPQGSALTFTRISSPANGTILGSGANLTYVPNPNFHGSDSFVFRVNDGQLNSANATVSIAVTSVNDAPVAAGRTASTHSGNSVSVAVTASDVDGDALSYHIVASPSHGSLSGSGPNWIYTPAAGYSGGDFFTYYVNDGSTNSSTVSVSISVETGNLIPTADSISLRSIKGKKVKLLLSGNDPESAPLTYQLLSQPSVGILSGTPPNLVYKPERKWTGEVSFSYLVSDGENSSHAATVSIQVKDKNRRPAASAMSVEVIQNQANPLTLVGTDVDDDPLTYELVRMPKYGTLTGDGANVVYTPTHGFRGKDLFTFRVFDGIARSKAVRVNLNVVNPNNRPPIVASADLSGPARRAVIFQPSATDPEGDPVKFSIHTKPSVGKLGFKKGSFRYSPPKKFEGIVSFSYIGNDGLLDSTPATVTITIGDPSAAQRLAAAGGADLPILTVHPPSGGSGQLNIEIVGIPGNRYMLEKSSDLIEWEEHGEIGIGDSGQQLMSVPLLPSTLSGFFRLSEAK